eukprot:TRINITY_DN7771_c1_g2_i4.p1 TRINITY_DN7771_c1_g2~~TRINITY_DN7771_c1_g2_i4.p1  ORF type:complete len:497 (-),score=119.49 TRINITY_DN7771_c1_g2_i4:139-1563(-)
MDAIESEKGPDGRIPIPRLTKMMIAGQNNLVMQYLRTLPKEECDDIRTQLVKQLEEIQKRRMAGSGTGNTKAPVVSKSSHKGTTVPKKEPGTGSSKSKTTTTNKKVPPISRPPPHTDVSTGSVRGRRVQTTEERVVGNYTILDELGKGMFGVVYKATNNANNLLVAIKEIDLQLIEPAKLNGVMQEAQLLSRLDDLHIVRIYDSLQDSKKLYFVLEYIDRGSLAKLLRNIGTFPANVIVNLVKQTLEGLKYLHDKNVIHRDIKSDNLLINTAGIVKVADFGTAKEDVGKTFTVIGTPYWMAPEIIEVSGARTTSDIWSMGCTVIEMLTGQPPYFEKSTMQALFSIVEDDHPPIPPNLTPELNHFLKNCCFLKNPERRPTSTLMLEHPWIKSSGHVLQPFEEIQEAIIQYNAKKAENSKGTNKSTNGLNKGRELLSSIKVVMEETERLLAENTSLREQLVQLKGNDYLTSQCGSL